MTRPGTSLGTSLGTSPGTSPGTGRGWLVCVLIGVLLAGCGAPTPTTMPAQTRTATPLAATATPSTGPMVLPVGTSRHRLTIAGELRTYRVYRPRGDGSGRPLPLVVMLHGGFGSGEQAEQDYGWNDLADREHVLIAYPDGLLRAWNVGGGCCGAPGRQGIDDVAFLTAMVTELTQRAPAQARVDPRRVFAAGISNGGMMAYRLACDTTLFAAIAADSATMLGDCAHRAPVSVMHVHGTADRNIPYDGSPGGGIARIDGPPVPDLIAGWRSALNCRAPAVSTRGSLTTATATCPGGRIVELVTIDGAGHQWPGGRSRPAAQRLLGLDPPSTALDATPTIWRFFRRAVPTPA